MMSRGWFYVTYMIFLVGLIYLVEYFVGNVYARYVLAYTGAIFIIGMLIGQRSEREWIHQAEPVGIISQSGKSAQGRKS